MNHYHGKKCIVSKELVELIKELVESRGDKKNTYGCAAKVLEAGFIDKIEKELDFAKDI